VLEILDYHFLENGLAATVQPVAANNTDSLSRNSVKAKLVRNSIEAFVDFDYLSLAENG
jgi:hypothetical protein